MSPISRAGFIGMVSSEAMSAKIYGEKKTMFITLCSNKLFDMVCTRALKTLTPPPAPVKLTVVSSEAMSEKIYGEITLDCAVGLKGEEPQRRPKMGSWRPK